MRPSGWLAASAILITLTGCGSSDDRPAPTPAVHAAYVVMAPGADGSTIAIARAIVEPGDPPCPTLRGTSRTITMRLRGNPFGFPVNVCEARIPFERRFRLSWTNQPLPIVRREPTRLLLLGDTGCRAANCAAGTPAAPFDAIAANAATQTPAPELIIHLGDYNYRGTAGSVPLRNGGTLPVYDAGDTAAHDVECQLDDPYVSQNADYSLNPDNWTNWWEDFFQPAAPLFATAPWVMVRGNHELCSRAGPGFFYFLDASADGALGGSGELECPPQGGDLPAPPPALPYLQFSPPYLLDLGGLHLAVIDSANACDAFAPVRTTEIYSEQLADVRAAVPDGAPTWIATHRPFWGLNQSLDTSLSVTLQHAWTMAGAPADVVSLVLAGHIHTFQSLTVAPDNGPRPPQLIVGGSGVALGNAPVGTFTDTVDGEPTNVLGIEEFSQMRIDLDDDGAWSGVLVDPAGAPLATCATDYLPGSLCRE